MTLIWLSIQLGFWLALIVLFVALVAFVVLAPWWYGIKAVRAWQRGRTA